jgi:hypothetical protein
MINKFNTFLIESGGGIWSDDPAATIYRPRLSGTVLIPADNSLKDKKGTCIFN